MPTLTTDLEADARRDSDTQRTLFVTATDYLGWANDAINALYDIVDSAKQPHFHTSADFSVTTGNEKTVAAAINNAAITFKREIGMTRDPGISTERSIYPLDSFHERHTVQELRYWIAGQTISFWPRAFAIGSYRLHFVPKNVRLTAGQTIPEELEPYREFLVAYMARKALIKRKQSTQAIDETLKFLTGNITVATSNRRAEPRKIPLPRNEYRQSYNGRWPDGTT